ncbi:acyltransferase [Shewanella sp. JM162201]|uniref:Acyltransferase n=1 Tax=Shewanella jiangmenensis TaxID=2837387 RepID=A0ABS5UY59_9GAMM|nr:acyltransferase [Shewanella jiangmenensis]MBT1443002.1 acyltransferase [Shewanella jiangmenensis]
MLKAAFLKVLFFIKFDIFFARLVFISEQVKAQRYRVRFGNNFNYVNQGPGGFEISGPAENFSIGKGSHIKSATFIECSGGVSIGDYFHTGRGLTIFSTTHNWKSGEKLPYDNVSIKEPVVIGDYVWCGANVTILPGTCLGDGVVIAAGSVVRGIIPERAVVAGNPASVISYRDKGQYDTLINKRCFF